MNLSQVCFYISVFYLIYLEYIDDSNLSQQFAITIILGIIAILNRR